MYRQKFARALISYTHEGGARDQKVREIADRLRQDGIDCDLDQYHESPEQGWPAWMSGAVRDEERAILVVPSDVYLRRWNLAEESGVGLGAKYEGKLLRQVLYEAEGLNGRVIAVVLSPGDAKFIPFE